MLLYDIVSLSFQVLFPCAIGLDRSDIGTVFWYQYSCAFLRAPLHQLYKRHVTPTIKTATMVSLVVIVGKCVFLPLSIPPYLNSVDRRIRFLFPSNATVFRVETQQSTKCEAHRTSHATFSMDLAILKGNACCAAICNLTLKITIFSSLNYNIPYSPSALPNTCFPHNV